MTRRVLNSTSVTLDGVIEHMEQWHFDYTDEEYAQVAADHLRPAEIMLLGRRTYEGFAEAWPSRTDEFATKINTMPKYVASTTLTDPTWANTTVIATNLADEVRALKDQPGGDIITYGFGPVHRELLAAGLIDEIHLSVHPVLAGVGRADELLFQPGCAARLDLAGTKVLGSGVVVHSYRPLAP